MPVDILDPNYWIRELVGSILVFSILLVMFALYITSKLKLNMQWTSMILLISFLMLPILFDGFLTWVPLIIIVVGIISGLVFNRFFERS